MTKNRTRITKNLYFLLFSILLTLKIKIFYDFVKKLSRAISYLHFMNYCTEKAFDLCLGTLSYSFLSLGQLPTFNPLHFQCYKMFLKVSWMWSFSLMSLLLGHFHAFLHSHFSHVVNICLPWVPLVIHLNSLKQLPTSHCQPCLLELHWHQFKFHFEH